MVSIEKKQTVNNIEPRVAYHTGHFTVINMCNFDLTNLSVRHSQKGVVESELFIPKLGQLETAKNSPKEFQYITGFGAAYDYWYIEFKTIFGKYATKSNFYCSLTYKDDGNVVILITPDMKAKVRFSSSSSCSVSLNKKQ